MRRTLLAVAMSVLMLAGCAEAKVEPLARFGLAGKSAVEVIDRLDRLALAERPADLKASVRPDALLVTADGEERSLAIPDDKFYLSLAPYVEHTHECFHHSLTTCKGELAAAALEVRIVDQAGAVLVEGARTTFANGFVGFWLPRGITGTVRVTYAGKTAESAFSTGPDAPTCLTTLQLA
ncbi:hypothetical protein BJ973_007359 [Actinoplanes tereljensis]|nr:CueP family metal-binding protein [Actinoplanes tereljensis]